MRRLVPVSLDHVDDLPRPCRTCVFWELDEVAGQRARDSGDPAFEKEAWLSGVLLEWGSCGVLAYDDGRPVGYALYAPPAYVPRATAFPTSPVSGDAALLTALRVHDGHRRVGLGRTLVQHAVKDLVRHAGGGVRALEAFGDTAGAGPCVLPADFLLAVGFTTVRPHPRWPRLRLDLRSAVSWREDVEVALERILSAMAPEPVVRPG